MAPCGLAFSGPFSLSSSALSPFVMFSVHLLSLWFTIFYLFFMQHTHDMYTHTHTHHTHTHTPHTHTHSHIHTHTHTHTHTTHTHTHTHTHAHKHTVLAVVTTLPLPTVLNQVNSSLTGAVSHGLRVHTRSSVLYFNERPTSVFQIMHTEYIHIAHTRHHVYNSYGILKLHSDLV